MQDFQTLLELLVPFIQIGFVIGIVVAVIIAAAKIGFKIAPYVLIGAALIYFLG